MNSYNKQALDIIAKEQGFIRDNLEKVMRLVEILNYFHDSPLLFKSLVLKGGTAINLTVFQLPRLSVDNMSGNSMTRRIFQNCCSRIKRWSIESNFILWLLWKTRSR